jgi:hypothetical protein
MTHAINTFTKGRINPNNAQTGGPGCRQCASQTQDCLGFPRGSVTIGIEIYDAMKLCKADQ